MTVFNKSHLRLPDLPESVWNITEVIEHRARLHPAAPALILPDRVFSYRELVTAVHVIAIKLLASGIDKGQTVGVSMAQTSLHLATLLAIARIGAIAVPLHGALTPERRMLAARRFNVVTVVSGREDMRLDGWPFIQLAAIDLGRRVPWLPATTTRADDPCWLSLSSGTTGDPKGVLRTHGYMLDRVRTDADARDQHSRLLPLDLNFSVGFGQALRMLLLGGAVVLAPERTAANLAYMVRSHAVTHWLLSPAIAEGILELLDDDDVHFPSLVSLRILGGAPSPRLIDAMARKFTPNVRADYGVSEVGIVAIASPEIIRCTPDCAGEVAPWVTVQIVDERERPVPAGQSGRLRLKADQMFDRFYLDQELTAERFRDGWYYPYDNARLDADGLLYIEGRQDDVFNVGGNKVQFRDVETVLEKHPAVREAAAFVLPQLSGLDLLAVAVMVSARLPTEELLAWARRELGPICPERLFFVDEFERTMTGKVLRDRLSKTHA
ncbi:class I adenylate-forming enzyme family protein [Paraburkholderia tropica]|uniref:class I adenylate-forming enzyme family protein n=1 Tax=Paraburkholderia tropica TaxID=92647 RepID=UPI002AB7BE28|nr:class I adenylate-forming enzyme family protein [Paraburkholderia tropica]